MTPHDNSRLERRIAALEERVRMLEGGQPDAAGAAQPAPDVERGPIVESSSAPSHRGVKGPVSQVKARPPRSPVGSDAMASIKKILRSEDLINKVGIFLLLIGLAFLFKWGIDRGWITPVVRVAFGAILGAGLVVFGTRIRSRRVRYGQVLVGGGIATLYITLFSAFQLYELLSYPVALTLMTGVTALSFALSLRQADVVLAIIATAGGLGTPFLLLETPSSILWLVVYTSLIAACAIAIFFEKGWRSLLLVTVIGGWSVMTYAWSEIVSIGFVPLADRTIYQLGVVFCLAAFGFAPSVREFLARRSPDRWVTPAVRSAFAVTPFARPAVWLAVAAPLISLALSHQIWDLSGPTWGAIEVVAATGYWAVHLFSKAAGDEDAASSHGVAAALVLAVSWFHLFESDSVRLLALAAEAAAIHVATYVTPNRSIRALGHGLFAVVAAWMAVRLLEGGIDPSLVSGRSLTHIGVLLLALGSSLAVRSSAVASAYRVVVALLLGAAWFSFFGDGSNRFLAVSLQAAALILWTQYHADAAVRTTGHALFGVALLAIEWRLTSLPAGSPPLLNTVALVDLSVIVVAMACSWLLVERRARLVYRFAAYLALLVWFWRDLAPLDNGHAFISIAWGIIAIVLIMIGWRTGRDIARVTGLTTLGIVVAKLFIVDLAELDTGWRVVLFIGLGVLLLSASYLFPSIWKGDAGQLKDPLSRDNAESAG